MNQCDARAADRAPKPGALIARGVCRALTSHGFACLTEFTTRERLRMDVVALGPKGEVWCVEVKSSRADFRSDRKWHGYLDWCDALFFAVPQDFPTEILPPEHGLILADAHDGEILRHGAQARLVQARRKALTLQIARLAADRLRAHSDAVPRGPILA